MPPAGGMSFANDAFMPLPGRTMPNVGAITSNGLESRLVTLAERSRTILTRNESPDVPFNVSINPYKGCEHGCVYCFARPYHEYLGFSAGLDFETRIVVKEDAPALLRKRLAAPRWKPQTLMMSGATDPYQPIERRLRVTRGVVEVLAEFRNPVAVITKNHLVTRDLDLLGELPGHMVELAVEQLQIAGAARVLRLDGLGERGIGLLVAVLDQRQQHHRRAVHRHGSGHRVRARVQRRHAHGNPRHPP